jgi:hypothetical protein
LPRLVLHHLAALDGYRPEVISSSTSDVTMGVMADGDERSRVVFDLEPEDDWPPVEREGLWAEPLGEDEYRLDNVPWFARGVASGDRVLAQPDADGVLKVRERLEWSGRYTIRVIPCGSGTAERQVQEVIDTFSVLGAECEGALPSFRVIALDIPPTARLSDIKALLIEGEADGRWGYEEGCVDEAWKRL